LRKIQANFVNSYIEPEQIMDDFFVHESSYVDEGVVVGEKTKIWHFCHIMSGTRIGEDCSFGQNCVVGPKVYIGNNVKAQNNISIYTGVEIEDDVFLGPSMVFTNVINPRSAVSRKDEFKKTLLKKGCSIGANSTVICGVTIGRYALIGAGSVISKDIPDFALIYGVPACQQGWISKAGNKLDFNAEGFAFDPQDQSRYQLQENRVEEISAAAAV
jgi:UDP-2-acetamido-3-amino-2,3-dideoxy-glucuronate N-acetyltransferase